MKKEPIDKKKLIKESKHLTRPPRLEDKVRMAKLTPTRKKAGRLIKRPAF